MPCKPVRPIVLLALSLAACFSVHCQDIDPPSYEQERAEPKTLEIKNLKLFAWQLVDRKTKRVEVQEFREAEQGHLVPSDVFEMQCDVVGGDKVLAGDYFLWTTAEFLVAPVTREYEQMDNAALDRSVAWGQITEMRDLKATPIYGLRPDESRKIVVKGLDLNSVLAAFPVGEDGELWPWLMRITVHVQDRSGKQLTSEQRTLRLTPNPARKRSRYHEPPLKDPPLRSRNS